MYQRKISEGLGISSREGKGYPFQYSGLENFMDCTVHGVTKKWTRLSDIHVNENTVVIKYFLYRQVLNKPIYNIGLI